MKKIALILCLLFLCLLCVGCTGTTNENIQNLKKIITDVYTPETMEQFDASFEEYSGGFLAEDVAKQLYVKRGDELTEKDKNRKIEFIEIRYSNSENNSLGGADIVAIEAKLTLDTTYINLLFKFYIVDNQVIAYSLKSI